MKLEGVGLAHMLIEYFCDNKNKVGGKRTYHKKISMSKYFQKIR